MSLIILATLEARVPILADLPALATFPADSAFDASTSYVPMIGSQIQAMSVTRDRVAIRSSQK